MLHVYSLKRHVAMIGKPDRCADAYRPEEPWLLLRNDGRVDRFVSCRDAKDEAMKTYLAAVFSRREDLHG